MISLIIGGSGSGKSEYAENLAVQQNLVHQGHLVYIATMQPYGEESKKKILRHQKLRRDKNFQTIECFTDLSTVSLPKKATVLLECMSNLVANEMFSGDPTNGNIAEKVEIGIRKIEQQADHLIIVTNNVFEDGFRYDDTTLAYMQVLGLINRRISSIADQVIEVIHGIPVSLKDLKQLRNK